MLMDMMHFLADLLLTWLPGNRRFETEWKRGYDAAFDAKPVPQGDESPAYWLGRQEGAKERFWRLLGTTRG